MHCSGLLRGKFLKTLNGLSKNVRAFNKTFLGLHPPHRVKSIAMSTFTSEEVERLKTLGNAVNARIYLGLYDGRKRFEPRIDDEVRAHLIEKYENRRW